MSAGHDLFGSVSTYRWLAVGAPSRQLGTTGSAARASPITKGGSVPSHSFAASNGNSSRESAWARRATTASIPVHLRVLARSAAFLSHVPSKPPSVA